MADFPTALTNAQDGVTDVLAKHINNIEAKVGIDGSAVQTSHDYKLSDITGANKAAGVDSTQTLTNKTLTSPVLTTPQINDTSLDHQYVFASSELSADRTVTLPLLTGNDEFVFKDHTQTLTNKTMTSPVLNTGVSGTAVVDEDAMTSDSATKIPTQQSVKAYVDNNVLAGWLDDTAETWTYASASSFTIAGVNLTTKYTKGTRIKLTQTSVKYFVVTSSSFSTDTTVNVTGGIDYTVANAAISANYHSYQAKPQGFPYWFNYTPSTTPNGGGSYTPAFRVKKFSVVGTMCTVQLTSNGHTISGTVSTIDYTLPINDAAETSSGYELGVVGYNQSSTQILVLVSGTGAYHRVKPSTGNFATNSGNGYLGIRYSYEF